MPTHKYLSIKVSSYFKPWRSPNFQSIRGSGFFFEDTRNFPGMKGLILTNAHVAALAEAVDVSNGREKSVTGLNLSGYAISWISRSSVCVRRNSRNTNAETPGGFPQ